MEKGSAVGTVRLDYVDRVRGLIMAIMALDHVRIFVARDHPAEFWGVGLPIYDGDAVAFLTRLVSHLCAPGFFFLMGLGMVMFSANRRETQGWSRWAVSRYFLLRGGLLVVLQHVLENPAWLLGGLGARVPVEHYGVDRVPGDESALLLHFGVLGALGAVMVLWGLLLQLGAVGAGVVTVGALLAAPLLLPGAESAHEAFHPLFRLLLVPGRTGFVQVYYPIVPWLGVAGLGVLCGGWLQRATRSEAGRGFLVAGSLSLLVFVALRSQGLADFHGLSEPGWVGWFNVTKYPPSIAFLLLTLGVVWVLLGGFALAKEAKRPNAPLTVLGQTALGFYIAHLYVYALCNFAFPNGGGFVGAYAVWLVGLVPLYGLCRIWRGFKRQKPASSLWRMF